MRILDSGMFEWGVSIKIVCTEMEPGTHSEYLNVSYLK